LTKCCGLLTPVKVRHNRIYWSLIASIPVSGYICRVTAAVVILNYNGEKFLRQFLRGVVDRSEGAKIYLADNASTDASVNYVRDTFPSVHIIINKENGGFAKGYNDALKSVEEDIYILLNSDIEVTADWIQPCLDLLKSNENIAAVQPKILSWHNREKFEHAGACGGFLDKNYYPFCQGRIVDITEEDEGQYNENKEVFWATGACLFIRKEVFREHEGFDEDFFAHMEEIDLCWRIKSSGKQIWYCADSKIYHVGGGTLSYNSPEKTFLNFRNSLYLIMKNHRGWIFSKLYLRMILDGLAAAMFLLKGEWRNFLAVIKAHLTFYSHFGIIRKKRKIVQAKISSTRLTGIYHGSVVLSRYLGRLRGFRQLNPKRFS